MLKVQRLSNVLQKRLIRPLYAQTQATPFATSLDATTLTGTGAEAGRTSFKNADGSRYLPKSGNSSPLHTRTADAFTYKGALVPGTVMVRTVGESVAVAAGPADATEQPFGLLANFIGGELDDLGENDEVGVWRGANHAFFELLSPAYNDTGLATALGEAKNKTGGSVYLYAAADGRLQYFSSAENRIPVARNRPNRYCPYRDRAIGLIREREKEN
jgi:hypothetical protein